MAQVKVLSAGGWQLAALWASVSIRQNKAEAGM